MGRALMPRLLPWLLLAIAWRGGASGTAPQLTPAAARRLQEGMSAAKEGAADDALRLLQEAASLAPNWAKPLLKMAHVHAFVGKDADAAAEAYAEAIRVQPEHADAYYFLGRLHGEKRPAEAIGHLETALRLALASAAEGAAEGAEESATSSDVSVKHCQTELLAAYRREGSDDAEARLTTAVLRAAVAAGDGDTNADALYALGSDLAGRGEDVEAAVHFSAAAALRPEWALAHARHAECLQAVGRLREAREAYGAALALKPNDARGEFNCGVAAREMGDARAAANHFERVARLQSADEPHKGAPSAASAYFNMALMHRQLGADDEAEEAYRKSIDISPSARAYYNLANLLRDGEKKANQESGQGDGAKKAAAEQAYERAINLDAGAADAYQQLRRLRNVPNVVTTPVDRPLVVSRPLEMAREERERLRADVLSHQWTSKPNRLSDSFRGTRGFVVRFSKEGLSTDLAAHPMLRCLLPYVQHVALPDANVFVMNVLVVPPANAGSDAKGSDDHSGGGLAVQRHLDNTLAICTLDHSFVADQVDVLYVSLPRGMRGGELCVWRPNTEAYSTGAASWGGTLTTASADEGKNAAVPPPAECVTPEENLHVSFRGDAKHGVRAWQADDSAAAAAMPSTSECRVSLVLEQYRVPEQLLPRATRFEVLRGE